jgi:hypothetical protein
LARRGQPPRLGACYRIVGSGKFGRSSTTVWEVEGVVTGADGRDYARLFRIDGIGTHKLVVTEALNDRSLYEPVPDRQPAGER